MKLTIELSEEEVQAIIERAVGSEASKHGHADMTTRKISWTCPKTREAPLPLSELGLRLVAEIETK